MIYGRINDIGNADTNDLQGTKVFKMPPVV